MSATEDGSKIKTLYYACGGWVMKGASACEKFLIQKEPLEDLLMATIQDRLLSLLSGEGERILRSYIEDESAAQGQDPRRELANIRARVAEIEQKADVLLEGLSADTKGFVDAKLRRPWNRETQTAGAMRGAGDDAVRSHRCRRRLVRRPGVAARPAPPVGVRKP